MTTLVENYVEKRRHGRARAGLPVIYHYESPSARNRRVENVARTINVSAGGLCMTVRDDITRETPRMRSIKHVALLPNSSPPSPPNTEGKCSLSTVLNEARKLLGLATSAKLNVRNPDGIP